MTCNRRVVVLICSFFLGFRLNSAICHGFYEGEKLELQGYTSLAGGFAHFPSNEFYFPEKITEMWQGDFRLLSEYRFSPQTTFTGNILESVQSVSQNGMNNLVSLPLEIERSSFFTWKQKDSEDMRAHLSIDIMTLQTSSKSIDIKIGRQPINLATTFYFVPNDFFAPFSAQTFFRAYKPGVDAVRVDIRPANLSLISLVGALGYEMDPTSDNGWENHPQTARSSLLVRATHVIRDSEWALLIGTVRNHALIGGSFQGEAFQLLGIRAEGHYAFPKEDTASRYLELSAGIEHRFSNSLDLRIEQFYHGSGLRSTDQINVSLSSGELQSGYLGTHYTALGMGYEFSALSFGQMVALCNWTDSSYLLSFNLTYSLGDESELTVNVSLPGGDEPEGIVLQSEFGTSPTAASLTWRYYF